MESSYYDLEWVLLRVCCSFHQLIAKLKNKQQIAFTSNELQRLKQGKESSIVILFHWVKKKSDESLG